MEGFLDSDGNGVISLPRGIWKEEVSFTQGRVTRANYKHGTQGAQVHGGGARSFPRVLSRVMHWFSGYNSEELLVVVQEQAVT